MFKALCVVVVLTGCATRPVCKPDIVIHWWDNPISVPANQRMQDIQYVTFINCKG